MNQNSLFSLEVVVDLINIPTVSCRFPAVAFRLLDFPTLLIHHVDPDLAVNIRTKLEMDSFYEVPAQFSELKDKHGNFPIKKGKSCLYKISAESLHIHLSNTPLYVMIIDTYPKVPKLLGSCAISLQNAIDCVFSDIKTNGLSLPTVHGEKGTHRIYNLMGSEIGYITLGYRLLSLGFSLLAHIPEQAISKSASNDIPERVTIKDGIVQTVDTIMSDIEITGKKSNIVISEAEESKENQKPDIRAQFTQTEVEKKTKGFQVKSIDPDLDGLNDIFVNNIDCPPPLFYNSKAETGNSFKLLRELHAQQDTYYDNPTDDIGSEISDLSLEEELGQDYTTYHKRTKDGEWVVNKDDRSDMVPQAMPLVENFPLLNALFRELTSLQDQRSKQAQQNLQKPQVTVVRHIPYDQMSPLKQQRPPAKGTAVPNLMTESEPEEARKELQQKPLLSTRQVHVHKHHKYHECEVSSHNQKKVPKGKGWLRQTPVHGQHKTKLKFGMTNTQRLRMAKTNPDALATMDKHPVSPRPKRTVQQHSEHREFANVAETSTLVQGFPLEQDPELVIPLSRQDPSETAVIQQSGKKVKRPVPTPRLSRDPTRESLFNSPAQSARESPVPSVRKPILAQTVIVRPGNGAADAIHSPDIPESQNSLTTSSKKSIEVHIPQAGREEDDWDDNVSQGTSDVSIVLPDDIPQQGKTPARYNPGFPDDDDDELGGSMHSTHKQNGSQISEYSEDFEDHENKSDDEENPETVVENKRYIITDDEKSEATNHSSKSVHSKHSQLSVKSKNSRESEKRSEHSQSSVASKLKIPQPLPPKLSSKSPVVAPRHSMQKRLLTGSDSFDRDSSPEPQARPRNTAYISQQPPKSPKSGSPGRRPSPGMPPSPSPPQSPRPRISRQPRVKQESVNTDSVSSYSPSDPDNMEFSMGTSVDTADGTM